METISFCKFAAVWYRRATFLEPTVRTIVMLVTKFCVWLAPREEASATNCNKFPFLAGCDRVLPNSLLFLFGLIQPADCVHWVFHKQLYTIESIAFLFLRFVFFPKNKYYSYAKTTILAKNFGTLALPKQLIAKPCLPLPTFNVDFLPCLLLQ